MNWKKIKLIKLVVPIIACFATILNLIVNVWINRGSLPPLPILSERFIKLTIPESIFFSSIIYFITFRIYKKRNSYPLIIDEIKQRAKNLPPPRISIIQNGIDYKAYIKDRDLSSLVSDGVICGDTNSIITRLSIQINPVNPNLPIGMGVSYRVHVQNEGWLNWAKNSIETGSNQNPRIEAVEIKLSDASNAFYIHYQVYVEGQGWTKWCSNGETAGTTGQHCGISAIRIHLLKIN